MNLRFDQPAWLALALVIVPLVWVGWRSLRMFDTLRRASILSIRAIVLAALAVALAGPRTVRVHHQLSVIGVLDVSSSVRRFADIPALTDVDDKTVRSIVTHVREWFRRATKTRADDDRFGLIVFDGTASVISLPVSGPYVDDGLDTSVIPGTNIGGAIEVALAMFPPDTARRIVLFSDGNETAGDALAAARLAAGGAHDERLGGIATGIPIDVIPITYTVSGDVHLVRVDVPTQAQVHQTITVRIVLDATAPVRGRLTLTREDRPVDLNGAKPGAARVVELPAGRSVHIAQVDLGATPINRFRAVFEPLDPNDDRLPENNQAEAFTATPGRGSTLVLSMRPSADDALPRSLEEAGIPVKIARPAELGTDILSLQSYDLIVLDDLPASAFDARQHELLARYVHDLGGGLLLVGGLHAFGAGGWNGSALEDVLPVELDPPKTLKLARSALVLVLDKSGSMNQPVAGTRTTQQRIANEAAAMAIDSLRAESLVGVITFDFGAHVKVPLQLNEDPEAIAQVIRTITAEGGTDFKPAFEAAIKMLENVEVEHKLVVCLSDGRSQTTKLDHLVDEMTRRDITLTTIAIGDDADQETLEHLADRGGGEFHAVRNPRMLPRVLVDSVQVINQPLIKQGDFRPVVHPSGSGLTANMSEAPAIGGLVITAPRPDPRAIVELSHPDGEPLLAHWQVGLGRVAAFTSDSGSLWTSLWLDWPGYAPFWTELVRRTTRPAVNPETELTTRIIDGRLEITLEAADDDRAFMDYLSVEGHVYGPDGTARPVKLDQTGPGSYQKSVPATKPGTYIVALGPRLGTRRLAPVIGGVSQSENVEFRRLRSNEALLDRIAAITGGRALDLADPATADLFDRTNLPRSRSALPVWTLVIWAAMGLWLIDVAVRRIAWSTASLKGAAARAAAMTHAREVEAAAALAARRRETNRATMEPTIVIDDEATSPTERTQPSATPVTDRVEEPTTEREPPREPDVDQVQAALDAFLGRSSQAPDKPDDTSSATEVPPAADEEKPDTTGSLLKARRRRRR